MPLITIYYTQPQLQDPWNQPLTPVLVFFLGEAADGEGDGLTQPLDVGLLTGVYC